MKCDLCNTNWDGETPAWTYKTVNTVSGPNDPSVPAGLGVWAEDDEWLVCLDCHLLIEQDDQSGLVARCLLIHNSRFFARFEKGMLVLDADMHQQMAKQIEHVVRVFWTARSIHPPVPEPGHRA